MASRASGLNVVLLSTASHTGLNVWHKIVQKALCCSLLPRGFDLGWLSFIPSILITSFGQTFGNALLAQKNSAFSQGKCSMFLNEYEKLGSLYEKGGKLLY